MLIRNPTHILIHLYVRMLTPEQVRSVKRTLCHIEAARSELRGLSLAGSSLDLEAQNNLVTAHVKLQMLLRPEAEPKAAGAPLKAPLRTQSA